MSTSVSIADLRSRVKIPADAAVAIAQQLNHSQSTAAPRPPFGPPSEATVFLDADGCVRCVSSEATPAVSEIAILLDTLVPAGSPAAPGGLRYAIARALLDVDAPPFDSVASFSEALARFEHGDRASLVRDLVERWEMIDVMPTRPMLVDRRRFVGADHLRRHLREADAQLYQRPRHPRTVVEVPQKRTRVVSAVAACLAAGVALVATGQSMHSSTVRVAPPAVAHVADPLQYPEPLPTIEPMPRVAPAAGRHVVAPRPVKNVRRVDVKPARSIHDASRSGRHAPQRGLLERMRLQWLKNAFMKSDSN
jgi:hypothetical protein